MLGLQRFLHASVAVSDLERAREFYGGVLGLEEAARPPFSRPGIWYQLGAVQLHVPVRDVTDSPDGYRHIFVKDPDGNLVEFVGPRAGEIGR